MDHRANIADVTPTPRDLALEQRWRRLFNIQGERSQQNKIWILKAPAGYGKTTILREMANNASANGGRAIWQNGDSIDILSWFSLQQGGDFGGQRGPKYLLIDDLAIRSQNEAERLVEMLRGALSSVDQVFITARKNTDIEYISYRLFDRIEILDQESLSLDEESVTLLFGDYLSYTEARQIVELTDGWPLAVHLLLACTRSLKEPPLSTAVIELLHERLAPIFESEFFSPLAPADADFLKRAGLFEQADGEVINEVLAIPDAWPRLDRLYREGALMRKINGGRGYTCNHLLRHHILRHHILRHHASALIDNLSNFHLIAANAFNSRGKIWQALAHAERTGKWQIIADIIERYGGLRLALASPFVISRYLDVIPIEAYRNYPLIALGQIYVLIQQGKLGYAYDLFRQLQDSGVIDDNGMAWVQSQLVLEILRMYHDQPMPPEEIDALEANIIKRVAMDRLTQAMIYLLKAFSYFRSGAVHQALLYAERLREINNDLNAELLRNYTNFLLGLCLLKSGHLRQAELIFETTVASSQRSFGQHNIQALLALALLARTRVDRLATMETKGLVELFMEPIEQTIRWYDGCEAAFSAASFVWFELEGAEAAAARLDAMAERYRSRQLTALERVVTVLKIRALIRGGLFDKARTALAEAAIISLMAEGARKDRWSRPSYFKAMLCVIQLDVLQHRGTVDSLTVQNLFQDIKQSGDEPLHMRVLITQTLMAAAQHNDQQGLEFLRDALRLAIATGIKRPLYESWTYLSTMADSMLQRRMLGSAEQELVSELARLSAVGTAHSPEAPNLSPREREVLTMLAYGLSSKEMANRLRVSIGTVKGYRRKLYEKLGVTSRSQAVKSARDLGLALPTLQ